MDVIVLDLDLGIRSFQIPYAWCGSGSKFLWDLKISSIPTLFWAGDHRCLDNWKPICNLSLGTGVLTQQLNGLDKISADQPGPFATANSSFPYPFQGGPYLDKKKSKHFNDHTRVVLSVYELLSSWVWTEPGSKILGLPLLWAMLAVPES